MVLIHVFDFSGTPLRGILESESKEKLIELLLVIASDSDAAEERIRLHLLKKSADKELDVYRQVIRSYIDRYSDDRGFVEWRHVSSSVEGAKIVVEKARAVIDEGDRLHGLEILFCVVEEMVELLQFSDDSSDHIGSVIEDGLASLSPLVQVRDRQDIPAEERKKMVLRLLAEMRRPYYEGRSGWQLRLLEAAHALIESDELQHLWDEAADSLLDKRSGGALSNVESKIARLRYKRIMEIADEEQTKAFLYEHMHFPEFREIAIRAALEQGDAEETIRLAEAGEAQDQGQPGTVNRWKRHRYEAYRRTGQVEQQRKLGMELVVNGEYSYYGSLKDSFSDEAEWSLYLQNMVDRLERNPREEYTYTRILVEEEMFERLLAHVRKVPYRIESFYEPLLPRYPEEVKTLLVAYIECQADQSRDRRDYADVCRIIRILQQVGGRKEASAVTQKLLGKVSAQIGFS